MARVLVVDDDIDLTDSYGILLKRWGHEVRKLYDGEAVLQQALAFEPHAVLLDIGLPGRSGYEVASRLREFQLLSNLKIIAVTGCSRSEDCQQAKDDGFDTFFLKPVDNKLLYDYLAQFNIDRSSESV